MQICSIAVPSGLECILVHKTNNELRTNKDKRKWYVRSYTFLFSFMFSKVFCFFI